MRSCLQRQFVGYLVAICGVAGLALLIQFLLTGLRILTAACILFILVLLVGANWGLRPALVASGLSALCLNYFFVAPFHTLDLSIDGSEDEIALVAFVITSVTAGRLFSNARKRADEISRLYNELRDALEQTTRLAVIERSERFKSALLDSVTHDLRTPLTSIKVASTTILDMHGSSPSSPKLHSLASENELLRVVVQQADRLNNFIDGLIELASVQGPRSPRAFSNAPMEEIINAAVSRASDVLRSHNLEISCQESLRATVNAKAVAQVLFAFLENAGKYAPRGTTVRVTAEKDVHGRLRTAVEDEGPGVPGPLRSKIFDKFFRGEPQEPAEGVVGGLGLGLAIAKEIAEVNGGQIWVEDREHGKPGARFVYLLPLEEISDGNHSTTGVL